MQKIRISHFTSAVCACVLALIFMQSPPLVVQLILSDSTNANVQDIIIPIYMLFYIGCACFLYIACTEAKYYVLTEEGISVCILGIAYREVKWDGIFDITIGPDPFQKYTAQTVLLNCQPGKKYRQQNPAGASIYEKNLYKDLFRGKVICLRCGRKLDSVLGLLGKYMPDEVIGQLKCE